MMFNMLSQNRINLFIQNSYLGLKIIVEPPLFIPIKISFFGKVIQSAELINTDSGVKVLRM